MQAFRLVKARYADDPLGPEGARRYGGRWNRKGTEALYAAESVALAALELLVHLQAPQLLDHYVLCRFQVPDHAIERLPEAALPEEWRQDPAPPATRALGDAWLASGKNLALSLPSTVIPMERNLLINPRHPDFPTLRKTLACEPFAFDPRLAG